MASFTPREYAHMAALPLKELARDCEVQVFHGHGPGGQGVNTADSAVRMTHVPTGIVVVSRTSRSQFRNRQLCLQKIREELRQRCVQPVPRRATKPTKGSQLRRMNDKQMRSKTKQLRGRVRPDEE